MIKEWYKKQIAEAYEEGSKKCLTDVVERCQFIYEVIADKAKQDIDDQYGIIKIPEVTAEEFDKA